MQHACMLAVQPTPINSQEVCLPNQPAQESPAQPACMTNTGLADPDSPSSTKKSHLAHAKLSD
ncbi:MAG TPA: hypothetical protein VM260_17655 [Pirellula sp.]|nr:hypothetical protein [Pirellula sp.]